jgi:DNA segregation ATPase FtsK/SpoIIIE, S-DNA-T family
MSDDPDELLDDAVTLVFAYGRASAQMLQRRLHIGYARAASLIETMKEKGLINAPETAADLHV